VWDVYVCIEVSAMYESVRRLRVSLSYALRCDYKEAPMCVCATFFKRVIAQPNWLWEHGRFVETHFR